MEKLSLLALPLVGNEVSGVTYGQERTPSTLKWSLLPMFLPFAYLDLDSDVDDKDSDGSETTHEDFGDADDHQVDADSVEESTV